MIQCDKQSFSVLVFTKCGGDWVLQISWADIEFYAVLDFFLSGFAKITISLEKYPKVNALWKKVAAHPKVAEWNAKKPPAEF